MTDERITLLAIAHDEIWLRHPAALICDLGNNR